MAEARLTIVTNLSHGGVTQYSSYDYNSFAWRRSTLSLYAANSDGLYTLESAATDNGTDIDCYLKTMKMGLGVAYPTNYLRGRVNYRSTGDLEITETADGWETTNTHILENTTTNGEWHTDDIEVDTGAWGNQWGFKIANYDGADVSINALILTPPSRKDVIAFYGVAGINNRLDPALAVYNSRLGLRDMAECVNMYVDDTFHAHRRRGCTRLTVGSFHSLYATPDGNDVYVVRETGSGGYLCRVQPDGSGVAIGSLLAPYAPMCYAWYDGVVYYSNGITNGRIVNSAVTTWPLSSPHASEVTVQKEFYAAPYGRLMCTHNGRIYMAQGDTVWFSEYGSPQRWRLATNVMRFEGQITMLEAAGDGIYVSDSVRVYFIDQGSSGARRQQVVCHYPAILGTSSTCDGNSILRGQVVKGPSVIWTSTNGVCAGGNGATFVNLTESKLLVPPAIDGAGVVLNKQGQSGGMPVLYIASLAA